MPDRELTPLLGVISKANQLECATNYYGLKLTRSIARNRHVQAVVSAREAHSSRVTYTSSINNRQYLSRSIKRKYKKSKLSIIFFGVRATDLKKPQSKLILKMPSKKLDSKPT